MTTLGDDHLNFGAGDPVPGWLNLDPSPQFMLPRLAHQTLWRLGVSPRSSRFLNAHYQFFRFAPGKRLPLASGSLAAVYCSHVLEHLPASTIPPLLEEFARVTRRGGVARFIVPDLASMAERAFRSGGPFVALDEQLGTLPQEVSRSPLRAMLEGAAGFPSFHRTAISLDMLADHLGSSWRLQPNVGYLESDIASERLRQVEQRDRFEQALAFELLRT